MAIIASLAGFLSIYAAKHSCGAMFVVVTLINAALAFFNGARIFGNQAKRKIGIVIILVQIFFSTTS